MAESNKIKELMDLRNQAKLGGGGKRIEAHHGSDSSYTTAYYETSYLKKGEINKNAVLDSAGVSQMLQM